MRMGPFSPRIPRSVRRTVAALDDGNRPVAEIWRDAGQIARRRRLHQPSYESIRRLVRAQRSPAVRPRLTLRSRLHALLAALRRRLGRRLLAAARAEP
jgi:hypothetical protein